MGSIHLPIVPWTPTLDDSWRINFAGHLGPNKAASGFLSRDQNAKFKAADIVPIPNCVSLIGAELMDLKHGLSMVIMQL